MNKKGKKWSKQDYIDQNDYLHALNEMDIRHDIEKRHMKPYEEDPQIACMYARQAKKRKNKVKISNPSKFMELPLDKSIIMEEIRIVIDKAPIKKSCSCKKK